MSRNKIIQTATRLTQRGQLDRAISAYERLVAQDPADIRSRLKIGELQQRQGQNEKAAKTLTEAAELYASQGFFLKAVAVYKQVLKLTNDVQANERLADLYQQLGLLSDAMNQLQVVVGLHEQAGRVEETVTVLRKMMELGPDNVLGRIRLAELLARLDRREEALEELRRCAAQLEKEGRTEDYLRVIDRILVLEPENGALARKAARLHLDKKEPRKALAKLQVSFKADPNSEETLELLSQAFDALGEQGKAVSVLKELARVLREAGKTQKEREVWQRVLRMAPGDAAAQQALGVRQQAPPPERSLTPPPLPMGSGAEAPAQPVARQQPVAPPPAGGKDGGQKGAGQKDPAHAKGQDLGRLLAEADVYLKYKLFPKAEEHIASLLAQDPGALDVLERGVTAAEGLGDRDSLKTRLLALASGCADRGDVERGARALAKLQAEFPDLPELQELAARLGGDSVSGMIVVEDEPSDDELVLAVDVGAGDVGGLEDEPLSFGPEAADEGPDDPALQVALEISAFEVSALEEDLIVEEPLLEAPVESAPAAEPVAAPEAESPPVPVQPTPAAEPPPVPAKTRPAAEPVAARPPVEPPPVPAEPTAAASAPPEPEAPAAEVPPEVREDLDEARFYIEQGMDEDAEELLRSILDRVPGHGEALELLARLGLDADPTGEAPEPKAAAAPPPVPAAAAPPPEPTPAPAPAPEPTPAPRPAGSRPPPPSFAGSVAPLVPATEGTFDLAAALLDDLGEDLVDDEPSEAPQAADFQYSVEEVLAEFKKGVSQTVRPEDSETHYNLGIAYKEMGLLEDAISQLDLARAGCVGTAREIDCFTTAGLCHAEMGNHEEAIASFRGGLGAAAVTADAALGLHFEIARSFEALGDVAQALEHYGRVQRVDPKYQGVGQAIERLGGRKDASELKTGKVGYV